MIYAFADCTLDHERRELYRAGEVVAIAPQALQVLFYLLQHRERVVNREELFEQCWPNVYVSDAALTRCLSRIRLAIGQTRSGPSIIKTVHGQGYRFVAAVTITTDSFSAPQAGAIPLPVGPEAAPSANPLSPESLGSALASFLTPESASGDIRSAANAERRHLTVLSCELVGIAHLAMELDPEDLHPVMQTFHRICRDQFQYYDGYPSQVLGHGLLAYFGYPRAHEDAAQRAVRAGLEIVAACSQHALRVASNPEQTLSVRVGIHTGDAVLESQHADEGQILLAVGAPPTIASCVRDLALPHTVVISEVTARLVAGHFDCHELGMHVVGGQPQPLYQVVGETVQQTRLEVALTRGLTPFIGRETDLAVLQDRWRQAQAGHGQMVLLVGEAGMGKSRLLLELRRQLGEAVTWLEGQTASFRQAVALYPLTDLLKRDLRIETHDTAAVVNKKIHQRCLPLGDAFRPRLPYMRYLLGVDPDDSTLQTMDPQLRRAELFETLRVFFLQMADIQPLVLVIEDLHWVDHATEAWLLALADRIPTSRVLCLFTYRPGDVPSFGDRTYCSRLALSRLSRAHSAQMARQVLSNIRLPETLEELVVQKAEGNPFFIEEMVRSFQESGAIRRHGDHHVLTRSRQEIAAPTSIRDVLMARIDRLAADCKKILQLASVIGREFPLHLLDRLVGPDYQLAAHIETLQAVELLYEKNCTPELIYTFKHALTQEVVYHSLLQQYRKDMHHRVGQAIEECYADRLVEYHDVLGYHFAMAKEWGKALDYRLKAADNAMQSFATREAMTHYDHALKAIEHLDQDIYLQTLITIYQTKTQLYRVLRDHEGAGVAAERLLQLTRQSGDRLQEGMALAIMGQVLSYAQDFDRALSYARQAVTVTSTTDDKSALANSHNVAGTILMWTGRLAEAWEQVGATLALSQQSGQTARQVAALGYTGLLKNWEGDYEEASRRIAICLQLSEPPASSLTTVLGAHFWYVLSLVGQGDYDQALMICEQGLSLAEKASDPFTYNRLLNSLGWLYQEVEQFDQAISLNQQSADGGRRWNDCEIIANAELNLSDCFLVQGDLIRAQNILEGVYRLVKATTTGDWMKWRYTMHLFASLGECWLAQGEPAKAQIFTEQCLEIATRTNSRKYLLKGWRLKGNIARSHHQWDQAHEWLNQALTMAQAIRNPSQLWKTCVAQGQLFIEIKQPNEARQAYVAARDVIECVKANIQTPKLRAGFDNALLLYPFADISDPDGYERC